MRWTYVMYRQFEPGTLRIQETSDQRHSSTSTELSVRHISTGAEVSRHFRTDCTEVSGHIGTDMLHILTRDGVIDKVVSQSWKMSWERIGPGAKRLWIVQSCAQNSFYKFAKCVQLRVYTEVYNREFYSGILQLKLYYTGGLYSWCFIEFSTLDVSTCRYRALMGNTR